MKTVRRRVSPMAQKLSQYLLLKKQVTDTTKQANALRDELIEFTEANHHEDDKGHHIHTLPEGIDYLGQHYTGFMYQKKSGGQVFLEDVAQILCEKKGFDPDEYTTRYVDQDKIVRLYAEDRLTEEEFNTLWETNDPTWAFVPVKG